MSAPMTAIETVSGRLVDLADPQAEDIVAEDIAWALSREPRFGGHTISAIPYSVAQHSCEVARILHEGFVKGTTIRKAMLRHFNDGKDNNTLYEIMHYDLPCPNALELWGLLHDASEAYMRDLPSPVKSLPGLREAYLEREAALMKVIFEKYGLVPEDEGWLPEWWVAFGKLVHWADLYARTIEAYHFMPSRGSHWASNQKVSLTDLHDFEEPLPAIEAYQEFLEYLERLTT
jgi:hypothetical protein